MALRISLLVAFAAVALLYQPVSRTITIGGITRMLNPIENIHGLHPQTIPNTPHAEDLHYHELSGLIFSASEPDAERRWSWFPPMDIFNDASVVYGPAQSTFLVIYPHTLETKRLELVDFTGPFITHGIDIWHSPSDPKTLYIIAINHLPNPEYSATSDPSVPQARSRVEIFRHTLGSTSAQHLRSVWDPLIRTPNDVLAVSEKEFYLTNDHFYRDGALRAGEDLELPGLSKHTDIVHISLDSLVASEDTAGVTATVAIKGLHNNNGLGYGSSRDEILIGRAAAGVVEVAKRAESGPHLEALHKIYLDSTIDNPSYFHDPYAKITGTDASGIVLAGLTKALQWPNPSGVDPILVWLVQEVPNSSPGKKIWTKKIIFSDDGNLISSGSTAVLVAINPAENGGRKQARLFISGPVSKAIVVTTIDL